MKIENIQQKLERSGWFPERNVDPSDFVNYITNLNTEFKISENVKAFLAEYGGLKVEFAKTNVPIEIGIASKSKTISSLLSLDTMREGWEEAFKGSVYPISLWDSCEWKEASPTWSIILMNEFEEFFLVAEDVWMKLGDDTDSFLNNFFESLHENWIEIE